MLNATEVSFQLCWVFVAVHVGFSSCSEGGYCLVVVHGLLIKAASLVVEHGI